MFLDASAIVAILTGEEDGGYFLAKIEASKKPIYVSALSIFEAVITIARKESVSHNGANSPTPPAMIEQSQTDVKEFLSIIGAKELPINGSLQKVAIAAASEYGRFVAHPAQLNFGDCFAYACATANHLPLLFKGNDFVHTDIERA